MSSYTGQTLGMKFPRWSSVIVPSSVAYFGSDRRTWSHPVSKQPQYRFSRFPNRENSAVHHVQVGGTKIFVSMASTWTSHECCAHSNVTSVADVALGNLWITLDRNNYTYTKRCHYVMRSYAINRKMLSDEPRSYVLEPTSPAPTSGTLLELKWIMRACGRAHTSLCVWTFIVLHHAANRYRNDL